MDNILKLIQEENYSELKEVINEELAKKIADRIGTRKQEILKKLRGQ
jgi:ribosomal protein L32E